MLAEDVTHDTCVPARWRSRRPSLPTSSAARLDGVPLAGPDGRVRLGKSTINLHPPPSTSLHARRFLLVASFRGRTPPSSATLGAAAFLGGEDSRGTERLAARRGVASGRRRGRSLPAAMLVDLGRRTLIRRLREAQGVDSISFTVHPLDGKPNTVRP